MSGSLRGGRGLSQSTRRTVAEELGYDVPVIEGGRQVMRRVASRSVALPDGGRAALATGTEVLLLPEHWPALEEVAVHNAWFPLLALPLAGASAAAQLLRRSATGRRLLRRLSAPLVGRSGGPGPDERARTRTVVTATAWNAWGTHRTARVTGPSIYDLTAELLAAAADHLLAGRGERAGVVDGLTAFGKDGLTRQMHAVGMHLDVD